MLHIEDIANGMVERSFRLGDRILRRGEPVSHEDIRNIPIANRNALIDKGYLRVVPKRVLDAVAQLGVSAEAEKFVVSLGFGRFDVVEGRKINAAPVDRETAYELADLPLPA